MSQPISLREPLWWHLFALVALSAGYEALFLEHSNGELFDEGWPLNAAMQLHAGGQLYREAFFTFPPGHVWPAWIAWAWDPPGIWLARFFYAAFNVALCVSLYVLGCRLMPVRFAFWGALAVALAAPHSHLGHLLFGYRYLVFSVLALLALARALDRNSAQAFLVAGLFTGVALVFRLTPAFAVACGVGSALWVARMSARQRLRAGGLYALGIGLVAVPVLVYFASGVGLDVVWRETVVRVLGLQSAQSAPFPSLALPEAGDRYALHQFFVALLYRGFAALYLGYAVVGLIRLLRTGRPQGLDFALLCAVVVWGGVFMLRALGRSDDHHLNSALPPAVLLVAHGASVLFARLWRARPAGLALRVRTERIACALALLAWLYVQGFDRVFDPSDRGLVPMRAPYTGAALKPTLEAMELERLVGVIRENTAPDERVLDLSASPLLYVLTDRLSVGEFDLVMPGTFLDGAEEARFVERLEARPPAVVVWPGWPFDGDPERSVQRTAPQLSAWVLSRYRPRDPSRKSHRFVILVPR